MKRVFCLLLTLAMVLGLCACAKSEPAAENPAGTTAGTTAAPETTEAPAPAGFSVGFGRADITPEDSVPLAGYGNTMERMSQGAWDYIYTTCIAITDETGNTVLLYHNDLVRTPTNWVDIMRTKISEATGVAKENIMISATHTHSAPDIAVNISEVDAYYELFMNAIVKAGTDAMADRSVATLSYGTTQTENLNFVRHYNTESGMVVGDNFAKEGSGAVISHTTESEKTLQVVSFQREGKKPVVLVNWQGHPTLASTGSDEARANKYLVSADYVGACRSYVEKEADCLFAYFLSGSGNLNTYSRIAGEGVSKNHQKHGAKLGEYVVEVLGNLTAGQTGPVEVLRNDYTGKQPSGGDLTIELNAVATGSFAFVTAPYEMFDVTAKGIKEGSPYDMTFVITCANGANGYMPTTNCWDYGNCYEVRQCKFVQGTAEILEGEFVDMLTELKG